VQDVRENRGLHALQQVGRLKKRNSEYADQVTGLRRLECRVCDIITQSPYALGFNDEVLSSLDPEKCVGIDVTRNQVALKDQRLTCCQQQSLCIINIRVKIGKLCKIGE